MSKLRDKWASGDAAMGCWLSLSDTVSTEAVGRLGFDYTCVDMQHGLADYSDAVTMLQVLQPGDTTPVLRVPWNEQGIIGRALDAGAMGIIIPMVNTVAQAEAAVAACRYAPAGSRSFGPARAMMQEGRDYFGRANTEVACIPMIETEEALANLDDILKVPGVDAVYVGPADLSVSHGLPPGNNDGNEVFDSALATIVAACRNQGIVPGIHASASLAARRVEQGFRMITVSSDLMALQKGAAEDLAMARSAGSGEAAPDGAKPSGDRVY